MLKSYIKAVAAYAGYEIAKIPKAPPSRKNYDQDGLQTVHNHDFETEPDFRNAYEHGLLRTSEQRSHHGTWRAHIAVWAARTAMRREGDFVECGVYLGFLSSIVMKALNWNETAGDRKFFLVDSFEGVAAEHLTKAELELGRHTQYGTEYSGTFNRAFANLSGFKGAELIKGYVPDVLSQVVTDQVAYLSIDMNSVVPEMATIEYFWDRLVPGGVILMDDYAYQGYEPQKYATDELAKRIGFNVATLPTGQGLIIK